MNLLCAHLAKFSDLCVRRTGGVTSSWGVVFAHRGCPRSFSGSPRAKGASSHPVPGLLPQQQLNSFCALNLSDFSFCRISLLPAGERALLLRAQVLDWPTWKIQDKL